jgi:DNA-binding transcriptional regulator YhcF (GntR family)
MAHTTTTGATERPSTPFSANPDDELPVGVQLGWRLRALIAAGRLAPGERLPSVRALAEWAKVNVNTVRGVYARLEEDGVVATEHGRGTFVAESTAGSPEVERIAGEAIANATDAGVDPRDVAIVALVSASLPDALAEEPAPEAPEAEPEVDAAALEEQLAAELDLSDNWLEVDDLSARRELRRQIGRLEAQLASYRRDLEPAAERVRPAEPRIADVAELERTRDAMLTQLARARARATERARRERRAREVRDAILDDPGAHRWEVVSAPETGEPGGVTWQARPRLGPLGALMGWWRVKVSGGCPLAAPLEAAWARELGSGQGGGGEDVPPGEGAVRAGREHDDPDRQDGRLDGAPALPLRHRARRPVPVRAPALLVSDPRLDASG